MEWARNKLERRYGKVKRQQLPFLHTGIDHYRLNSGGIVLKQNRTLQEMKSIAIPNGKLDGELVDESTAHAFRSLLCSLLFITQCHLELAAGVSTLQSFNNCPTVDHCKQANALRTRALREGDTIGLYYHPLPPYVILDFDDASHGNRSSSYAQEGGMQLSASDF